jgi:5'-nucleotidase
MVRLFLLYLAFGLVPGIGSSARGIGPAPATGLKFENDARHITILGTNDIHGGIEPSPDEAGRPMGGLALWAGIVNAIKEGIVKPNPTKVGVLVLDAGDQFQGTLISNFNEGQLVMSALNLVGYDAIIPGNHDYDFGPIGWLVDQSSDPTKRREALLRVLGQARFPVISANTYYRNSIKDLGGKPLEVDSNYCNPPDPETPVNWSLAKRPEYIRPYVIVERAGVKLAIVGIDNDRTRDLTTSDNVEDLCFDDEYDSYLRVRNELAGQVDLFVMLIHDGDIGKVKRISGLIKKLSPDGGPRLVDAVVSGHTHASYGEVVGQVPFIQSGAGGQNFGRIDLFWDAKLKQLDTSKTRALGAVRMLSNGCDEMAKGFCTIDKSGLKYEGRAVVPHYVITALAKKGREAISSLATLRLGTNRKLIETNSFQESALADAMADALRATSKADLGMMNTGGLRTFLSQGNFTYEDLFKVLPFNNHQVVLGPVPAAKIVSAIEKSIHSCGSGDVLIPSGLKVIFQRNCNSEAALADGFDTEAKLIHVEMLQGEVLFDASSKEAIKSNTNFNVATLDFVSAGGSGFSQFIGIPVIKDYGIFREELKVQFLKAPAVLSGEIDGRWRNLGTGP